MSQIGVKGINDLKDKERKRKSLNIHRIINILCKQPTKDTVGKMQRKSVII